MRYELALFDFDGTLADSAEWFLEQMNRVAAEMGFRKIDPGEYERVRGFTSQEVMAHLGIPKWKLPLLMARMRKAAAEQSGAIQLFPGVAGMLARLNEAGIRVGIVSSNSERNVRELLGTENCSKLEVVSCGASLFGKAAKLRGVLRRVRVKAGAAIYIGDEIRDAVAAREVGMAFGAVRWGFASAEALEKESPELQFSRMEEIAERLTTRRRIQGVPDYDQQAGRI
jgi:phosphoglycolate phosphatase